MNRLMERAKSLDPTLTKRQLRAVIFRGYILYLQKNYPDIDLDELCQDAGLPLEYVLNDDNWVSVLFEDNFMREISKRVKDPELTRKVGEFGVRPEVIGAAIHHLCINLLTLSTLYKRLPFVTSLVNKIISLKIIKQSRTEITYELRPVIDNLHRREIEILMNRLPDYLENTVGYYSAIPTQKGLGSANVDFKELRDESGMPFYKIQVKHPYEVSFWKARAELFLAVIGGFIGWWISNHFEASTLEIYTISLASAFIGMFFSILRKLDSKSKEGDKATDALNKLDKQYTELDDTRRDLQRKLSESRALTSVVKNISSAGTENQILEDTCKSLAENLRYDRSVVLLKNPEKDELLFKSGYGIDENLEIIFKDLRLPIDIDSDDPKKISNIYRLKTPILIEDVESHLETLEDKTSRQLLYTSRSTSFAAVPISTGEKSYGVLMVDCTQGTKQLSGEDIEILSSIGSQIGVAIEKIRAHEALDDSLSRQEALAQSYSRFVPFELLHQAGYAKVEDVKIGDGVLKPVTVLFSDIRNFSSFCECMKPNEVLRFLNSYFGRISPLIKENNGVIDKFIGDCVMAIFDSPMDAVNAAVDLQRMLIHYNVERRLGGRRFIEAGIGICTGEVIMGPLGFTGRLDITVLSDAVNVASRLDGLCKTLNAKILVAGNNYLSFQSLPENLRLIPHGEHKVKGKYQSVEVFEIFDEDLIKQFDEYPKSEELARLQDEYISHVIEKMSNGSKKKAS